MACLWGSPKVSNDPCRPPAAGHHQPAPAVSLPPVSAGRQPAVAVSHRLVATPVPSSRSRHHPHDTACHHFHLDDAGELHTGDLAFCRSPTASPTAWLYSLWEPSSAKIYSYVNICEVLRAKFGRCKVVDENLRAKICGRKIADEVLRTNVREQRFLQMTIEDLLRNIYEFGADF